MGILTVDYGFVIPISFSVLIFLVFSINKSNTDKGRNNRILIISFLVFFYFLGFFRNYNIKKQIPLYNLYDRNTEVVINGRIDSISNSRDRISYTIYDAYIDNAYSYGVIVVYDKSDMDEGNRNIKIGDVVSVTGSLYPCDIPRNPGQFNEYKHYKARDIDGKLYAKSISVESVSDSLYDYIKNQMTVISGKMVDAFYVLLPEKEAGIMAAVLVGEKGYIDSDIRELYSEIGIAHILSISGLHITLLGVGLFKILMIVSKRLKFSTIITVVFIILYGIMTGFSVSTQRAITMLLVMLVGRIILKAYDGQSAAALSAIFILAENTFMLYDSGFQLSFVAVFSLFAANEIIIGLDIKNKILKYLLPMFFVQLGTLPIILSVYFQYNLLSLLANPVVLPLMSVLILSGVIGSLFYLLGSLTFGMISVGPAYYILKFYEYICEKLTEIKNAEVITGNPDIRYVLLLYGSLFYLIFVIKHKVDNKNTSKNNSYCNQNKKTLSCNFRTIISFGVYVFLVVGLFIKFDVPSHADFLDVGQGACVFIRNNGLNIIYDGGSSNIKNVGRYRIIPYLKYMGVDRVDMMFVSHTDDDHISGLKEVIEEKSIKVQKVFLSVKTGDNDLFYNFCLDNNVEVEFVKAGDEDRLMLNPRQNNNDFIHILAPENKINYQDTNAASMVLKIDLDGTKILLTGDSDCFSEILYSKYLNSSVDVLQVAHHGSKYSTSEALLDKTSPIVSVISCSKTNRYGHPSIEVLDRLNNYNSTVFKTLQNGRISIKPDRNMFYVETYIK